MAEKAADEEIPSTTLSIPSSEEDPPTTDGVEEKPTETDNDVDTTVVDQPKKRRRKNCPTSLDKFETIKQSAINNSGFSFTFDTAFCSTPDSTPKFGSFDITRCTQIQPKSEVNKTRSEELQREEEAEDEEKSEASTSIVVGEVIRSVDGVVESGVD
ncbi:hypothetical protein Vadar_030225 [Vaccinium darrowii]|uniref:Uncharacterized protein n=1 Tax=Vaccinium darrowii TaxID=229202 RepID=A0ACB7XUB7_9ERIC|nr:hypothetical protein Vadar_030225 [Vaccinium darrowii]